MLKSVWHGVMSMDIDIRQHTPVGKTELYPIAVASLAEQLYNPEQKRFTSVELWDDMQQICVLYRYDLIPPNIEVQQQ